MRVVAAIVLMGAAALSGCITAKHEVAVKDPVVVRVEPIHITMDVNIRVQKEVDQAFDFLYSDGAQSTEAQGAKP